MSVVERRDDYARTRTEIDLIIAFREMSPKGKKACKRFLKRVAGGEAMRLAAEDFYVEMGDSHATAATKVAEVLSNMAEGVEWSCR